LVRKVCEIILALRAEKGIKIRQPLATAKILSSQKLSNGLKRIIQEEANIKEISFDEGQLSTGNYWAEKEAASTVGTIKIVLNIEINHELKLEGLLRELVRQINASRKEAGLTINDKITLYYQTNSDIIDQVIEKYKDNILKDTISNNLIKDKPQEKVLLDKEMDLDKEKIKIFLVK